MALYRRVLLKISGETLMGKLPFGVSPEAAADVASKIDALRREGVEVAVVIGGGNIFRGIQQATSWGMERTPADQIGMLATLMNGIVLQQALKYAGADVRMMTALECPAVAESFNWEKADRHLSKGGILLLIGGTGHPFFTTDTCAALRACEVRADILLKATTGVDAIYDKDPNRETGAQKFTTLSYGEILERKLGIMDLSAITLCMQTKIPIRVFNFYAGPLSNALESGPYGTLVN